MTNLTSQVGDPAKVLTMVPFTAEDDFDPRLIIIIIIIIMIIIIIILTREYESYSFVILINIVMSQKTSAKNNLCW